MPVGGGSGVNSVVKGGEVKRETVTNSLSRVDGVSCSSNGNT